MYNKYIKQPTIDTKNSYNLLIYCYELARDRYNLSVEVYNSEHKHDENFVKKQPLKSVHKDLFKEMLHIARRHMDQMLFTYAKHPELLKHRIGKDIMFSTTNFNLAKAIDASKRTVTRAINRLIDAGILTERRNHGYSYDSNKAFYSPIDLFLSGDVVPIFDKETEILHVPKIFENASESMRKKFKRTKCLNTPEKSKLINTERPVDKEETTVSDSFYNRELKPKPNQNPHKRIKNGGEAQSKISEICARNIKEAEDKERTGRADNSQSLKYQAAKILLDNAVKILWSGNIRNTITEVYEPEYIKTLDYLAENYFEIPQNVAYFKATLDDYKKRLEMAARHVQKRMDQGVYTYWFVTPFKFFQKSNKKGFEGTRLWLMEHKAKKQERKVFIESREKLNKAIHEVYKSDFAYDIVNAKMRYVQEYIPEFFKEFCSLLNLNNPREYKTENPVNLMAIAMGGGSNV